MLTSTSSWFGISVVILTYNRRSLLEQCLDALRAQVVVGQDEIIVADTGSTDGTWEWLQTDRTIRAVKVVLPYFDFGAARNQAARFAHCPAIAFTDDDSVPDRTWLLEIRQNLYSAHCAGGPTLPGRAIAFPWWWHEQLSWCVGNSPPGTVLGERGYYPDNSNMAFHARELILRPFSASSPEAEEPDNIYRSGREDAEWWKQSRIAGRQMALSYRQVVFHQFDTSRLDFRMVLRRAYTDGVTAWHKSPSATARLVSAQDAAEMLFKTACSVFNYRAVLRTGVPQIVWSAREFGVFVASHSQKPKLQSAQAFGLAVGAATKRRASKTVFTTLRIARRFPRSRSFHDPDRIYVSADGHFGDTVMLRRHLHSLALSFPQSTVDVTARYPSLLLGLPDNIRIHPNGYGNLLQPDAALVPYYPFGNRQWWRRQACRVGATFDCDVGFTGYRDYHLASVQVVKNLEIHEHENLRRLFSQWPLVNPTVPPFVSPVNSVERTEELLPLSYCESGYYVVQFGAGRDFKEWPLNCWIPFLREFAPGLTKPIVLIGNTNWGEAGRIAVKECCDLPIFNYVGKGTLEDLIALVCECSGLVSACSGPKHLAMETDVPTFTLYGATEPERWGATSNYRLHNYVSSLSDRLTGPELAGLPIHHRMMLLDPRATAQAALAHFRNVERGS